MKTDPVDKNGEAIYVGDKLRTYDKTGKEWVGDVVIVDQYRVINGRNPQYAFQTNYDTWLHPEHMHLYERIEE